MKTAIIDLHYFPCLDYFTILNNFDKVILESHAHFIKQTYKNRCYIRISNQVQRLSVPVVKGSQKIEMKSVEIDYSQDWITLHWRSIQSAYQKAPFYDFFEDTFKTILYKKHKSLFALNQSVLFACMDILQMNITLETTKEFVKNYPDTIQDFRECVHPKKKPLYEHTPYYQLFGEQFTPNLSILDALFCEGLNTGVFIKHAKPFT